VTPLGEARYRVRSGGNDDECYANAYWDDDGEELNLGSGFGVGAANSPGGALTGADNLRFAAAAYAHDDGGDFANITLSIRMRWGNNVDASGCAITQGESVETYFVNSGGGSPANRVFASKLVTTDPLSYAPYWRYTVGSSTTECSTFDDGCFRLLNENVCDTFVDLVTP
jgi:hypothetical protein